MTRKYKTKLNKQGMIELYLDMATGTIMFFGVILFFTMLFKILIDEYQ
jgi:hypothetical protein